MSWDSWSCLMVQKGPGVIPDTVRAELKKSACELHLKKRDRMTLGSGLCDGIIQTDWEEHVLGTRSGVLFRSQFDWAGGSCKVNFLLSTDDLHRGAEVLREIIESEGGEWAFSPDPFPVKELYHFYDLRRRTLH